MNAQGAKAGHQPAPPTNQLSINEELDNLNLLCDKIKEQYDE
jgi:hypothetical protein